MVAPDLLGFGCSEKPPRHRYTIMEQADLVEALLSERSLERAHLLAHDYGDTVAQELLARDLERRSEGTEGLRWTSVALLNGGLFPETHRPALVQRLLVLPMVGPVVARAFTRQKLRENFDRIFGVRKATDDEIDAYWMLIEREHGREAVPGLIRYMPERKKHRARWVGALQGAAAAGVKLLLINGADDPISGSHMAERYRELVPEPDVVSLDGVGHYPQLEAPGRVLEAYLPLVARPGTYD